MVVVGDDGDAAGVVVMMVVVKNKKLCLLITCDVANTHKYHWTSNSDGIPLPSLKGGGLCGVRVSLP